MSTPSAIIYNFLQERFLDMTLSFIGIVLAVVTAIFWQTNPVLVNNLVDFPNIVLPMAIALPFVYFAIVFALPIFECNLRTMFYFHIIFSVFAWLSSVLPAIMVIFIVNNAKRDTQNVRSINRSMEPWNKEQREQASKARQLDRNHKPDDPA